MEHNPEQYRNNNYYQENDSEDGHRPLQFIKIFVVLYDLNDLFELEDAVLTNNCLMTMNETGDYWYPSIHENQRSNCLERYTIVMVILLA